MEKRIYQQERWSLQDLFPEYNTPEMQQALERVENKLQVFEDYRPLLSLDLDAADFMKIVRAYENL